MHVDELFGHWFKPGAFFRVTGGDDDMADFGHHAACGQRRSGGVAIADDQRGAASRRGVVFAEFAIGMVEGELDADDIGVV